MSGRIFARRPSRPQNICQRCVTPSFLSHRPHHISPPLVSERHAFRLRFLKQGSSPLTYPPFVTLVIMYGYGNKGIGHSGHSRSPGDLYTYNRDRCHGGLLLENVPLINAAAITSSNWRCYQNIFFKTLSTRDTPHQFVCIANGSNRQLFYYLIGSDRFGQFYMGGVNRRKNF